MTRLLRALGAAGGCFAVGASSILLGVDHWVAPGNSRRSRLVSRGPAVLPDFRRSPITVLSGLSVVPETTCDFF